MCIVLHFSAEHREFTRVSIKPPRSTEPIEDHADTNDDDDIIDEYDDITRGGVQPKRGPLQNYMAHNTI